MAATGMPQLNNSHSYSFKLSRSICYSWNQYPESSTLYARTFSCSLPFLLFNSLKFLYFLLLSLLELSCATYVIFIFFWSLTVLYHINLSSASEDLIYSVHRPGHKERFAFFLPRTLIWKQGRLDRLIWPGACFLNYLFPHYRIHDTYTDHLEAKNIFFWILHWLKLWIAFIFLSYQKNLDHINNA